MLAVPAVGERIVESIRSVVVLPAPFAPSSPNTSPSRQSKLTPSTAWIFPRDSSIKVFVRCFTTTGWLRSIVSIPQGCLASRPYQPFLEKFTKRAGVASRHKIFMLDDRYSNFHSNDNAHSLHRHRNRNERPIVGADDRLAKHHGDVDDRNERDLGREFLGRPPN